MVNIPQFFIWHMRWDAEEGKYGKVPRKSKGDMWPMDAALPHNWLSYADACATLETWNADATPESRYTLGFYLTPDTGYWFLDIDKCISNGVYSSLATEWLGMLPGCFFEFSSSGNGVHVIGHGTVPEHSKRNKQVNAELYTEKRGIAFGTSGKAWGSVDAGSPGIASIASLHFPPRAEGEDGEWLQPRADWSGPADDEELLKRALASKSLAGKLGARANFEDLWNNNTVALLQHYGENSRTEQDAALAQHLAFWTGCDAPRIERLMRRSALAREKWDMHRTYLRELTIHNACAQQKDVCKDRAAEARAALYAPTVALPALAPLPPLVLPGASVPALQTVVVTPEVRKLIDDMLNLISAAGDWAEVHNDVIPVIRAAGIPPAFMPRIETAVNKRLDMFDAKLPINKLRMLLKPTHVPQSDDAAVEDTDVPRPVWIDSYVYVRQMDKFFDITNGHDMSIASFKATHDRDMPLRGDSPVREDSAQWALQRWNVPLVHDTMYYPGKPAVVDYDRRKWANLYSESSLPDACAYTPEGVAAIERFQKHLWMLCGRREKVYQNLLSFMAHCVQFPGKLIRWVPLIKGTEGDGKSLITGVMSAAMGDRNVAAFGPELIANAGGFTDWAHGHALAVLEEIYMTGRERFVIVNRIKQFITNNKVSIHPKGGKPKSVFNTCCKIGYTNHNDGVPLNEEKDRRWFIVFTPYETLAQMNDEMGFTTPMQAREHFDAIFASLEREPGQWRAWLLSLAIPEWFTADGSAMATEEKKIMAQSGVDDIESLARSIVEEGAYGVTATVISSRCLSSAMSQRAFAEGMEVPKTHSMHHLMNRLGFMKMIRSVKWDNTSHRLWVKPGTTDDNDALRTILEGSKARSVPGAPL